MAEKRVTFKNDKREQIVGIIHDTGSEVATPYCMPYHCCMPCWPRSLLCWGDSYFNSSQYHLAWAS